MNEALERTRKYVEFSTVISLSNSVLIPFSGLMPNEDAPDIVANTFLAEVTAEELDRVGRAFLTHRECMSAHPGTSRRL